MPFEGLMIIILQFKYAYNFVEIFMLEGFIALLTVVMPETHYKKPIKNTIIHISNEDRAMPEAQDQRLYTRGRDWAHAGVCLERTG